MCSAFVRVLLPDLLSLRQSSDATNWEFRSYSAQVLMEQYKAGHLDLVVMMAPPDGLPNVAAEWTEQLVWVCRRRSSPLAAGKPIPFIGSNTTFVDRTAHNAFSQFNVPYRITLQQETWGSRSMPPRPDSRRAACLGLPRWDFPAAQLGLLGAHSTCK